MRRAPGGGSSAWCKHHFARPVKGELEPLGKSLSLVWEMTVTAPLTRQKPDRRRRGQQGKLNTLPEPMPVVDGTSWGPAMAALPSDRHRAFVLALYQVPPGYGSRVAAAKMAGFGSSKSTPSSWASIASRLSGDERIQAAIYEEDCKRIRSSAPRAIRALENMLEDSMHKDHARAVAMTLDRIHPIETRQVVDVTHRVDDHLVETLHHLRYLKSLNVSREVLEREFGFTGLGRYERLLALEDAKTKVVEGKPAPVSGKIEAESTSIG